MTHWLGLLFLTRHVWLVAEYQKPVLHSRHPKVLSVIFGLAWSKVLQFTIWVNCMQSVCGWLTKPSEVHCLIPNTWTLL